MSLEIQQDRETEILKLLNRSEVQVFTKFLMNGSLKIVEPEPRSDGVYTYPDVENITGLSPRSVEDLLEKLAEKEILIRELYTVVAICPFCGESRFVTELVCPLCDSSKLKRGLTIEHLECGYIGFEEEVKNMICPKCGKKMRALGVDYRKPGVMYRCLSCKSFTSKPAKKFACLKERHVFYEEEAASKEIYSYRLNPEKKPFVERWIVNLKPVVETLVAKGWTVQHPARVRGRSGVEHIFTLFAYQSQGASIIIDILINDKPIDESALSLIFKALDVEASKKIMVFVPELTSKARALFDYYRVVPNTFIFECKDTSEVQEAVLNIISA